MQPLENENDFIDPEKPIESNINENQLNSTQPANTSVAHVQTPCQMKPIADDDAEISIVQNENSGTQEQNSVSSSENVDSFQRSSLFEPNEKSTPVNEQKTKAMDKAKRESLAARPMRAVSYFCQ